MKKNLLLFPLASLAFVTACSETEITQLAPQEEMQLSSYVNRQLLSSRTSVTGAVPTNYKIGVSAWKTLTVDSEVVEAFTNKMAVGKKSDSDDNAANAVWAFTPAQYWDNAADSYTFYGYTPYTETTTAENAEEGVLITPGTLTYKNFTVVDAINEQQDLMVADPIKVALKGDVSLNFRHMLSNVHFELRMGNMMKDDDAAVINEFSADFSTIVKQGNLTYTYSGDQFGTVAWGLGNTFTDGFKYALTPDITLTTKEGENKYPVAEMSDLLMIPQATEYEDGNTSDEKVPVVGSPIMNMDLTFTLNDDQMVREFPIDVNWEANKKYTYIIIIGMNDGDNDGDGDEDTGMEEITFQTKVTDFTTEETKYYDRDGNDITEEVNKVLEEKA